MSRGAAAADAFAAIASPTRRRILELLRRGERSVGEICDEVDDVSQPAVSQQLGVLEEAGLVVVRKDGRKSFYRLDARPLREVATFIERYESFWRSKLVALGDHLDRTAAEAKSKKKPEPR